MSRGVRDLRDLICVSRLTIRDSDEEVLMSDEEPFLSSEVESREGSAHSKHDRGSQETVSPDSGIGTNGRPASPETESAKEVDTSCGTVQRVPVPVPPSTIRVGGMRRKKKRKTKVLDTLPTRHDLPKANPLPPVQDLDVSDLYRPSSSSSESSSKSESLNLAVRGAAGGYTAGQSHPGNFDELLTYLDATVVSEWLSLANANVTELTVWCHTEDNFIHFAHFWLSEFPDLHKQEMLKMEYSIVLDQLSFAFAAGLDSGQVRHKDLAKFLDAVFREYPARLFSSKGSHLFLDHLNILLSDRQSGYKRLLSDVKVSTRVKLHAQWCLAVRSFALVSVWSSVVNFYRKIHSTSRKQDKRPMSASASGNISQMSSLSGLRVQQAIRCGYVDVVNYLIRSKLRADYRDNHNRTLIFSAVMHSQLQVLKFLTTQTAAVQEINVAADTGNTPLHAAANSGSTELVRLLLQDPDIHVNISNSQCEGATALHLATMHGHTSVADLLLKAGADPDVMMGDLSVWQIASDFDHTDILQLLHEMKKSSV